MKKPLMRPATPGLRTWQEIGQRRAGRALSPVARRKRIIRGLGVAVTLGMLAGLGALGAWGWKTYQHDPAHWHGADADARLAQVDFQTDGVLTEQWARGTLELKNGDALPQYDVFALRRHLLATGQVREAFVERALPDTLRIRVTERVPVLRLAVDDGAGGYKPYLVARDGTIYSGQLYPADFVHSLPWLAGEKLQALPAGGFKPAAGMEVIEDLLTQAKADVPQLEAGWTVVDVSDFDARAQAPLSLLKVRSRDLGEVVFLAQDFHKQLERLALIAQDLHDKQILALGVDLSFDQQAVVKLAATPLPAKTPGHASMHAAQAHAGPAYAATNFSRANVRNSFTP
jgi:cell division septal protein FtsQ